MTSSQLYRISGLCLIVGASIFIIHVVLRSVMTAGVDPSIVAKQGAWIPVNALGLIGAVMVLLGLPAMYARVAGPTGVPGFVGVLLIALAWMFFGPFLSLYAMLVSPWLAEMAPSLVNDSASVPSGVVVAFVAALLAWFTGSALLGIPFIRGRVRPSWIGYLLLVSAIWVVLGDVVIAPNGPAADVAINLVSNLGPVLLLVALGYIGSQMVAGRPWTILGDYPRAISSTVGRRT